MKRARSIKLSQDVDEWVGEVARQTGVSFSAVVDRCLYRHMIECMNIAARTSGPAVPSWLCGQDDDSCSDPI